MAMVKTIYWEMMQGIQDEGWYWNFSL